MSQQLLVGDNKLSLLYHIWWSLAHGHIQRHPIVLICLGTLTSGVGGGRAGGITLSEPYRSRHTYSGHGTVTQD